MVSRSYIFTLNNPEEFDPDDFSESPGPLAEDLQLIPHLKYVIYQYEAGETFTLHFQGYIELSKPARISSLKHGQLTYAHFEPRKGTREQAKDYSSKDESRIAGPWSIGEWSGGQGSRTDLETATTSLLASRNLRELALQHPTTFVKFHGGLTRLLEVTRIVPEQPLPEWRDWQSEALGLLQGPPDPRKIHWFVDSEGGRGKSFLVRYLATNRGALPLSSGRHDRLLNAWNGEHIVTFDFSRDVASTGGTDPNQHDRTPYAVIESIKNGVVFSGFFGSGPRIYAVPHVLCFSNFEPDQSKLSADRWDIRFL